MQSKKQSFIEQIVNQASGVVVAYVVWSYVVAPYFELDVTFIQNIGVTLTFTTVSIIRGYFWRRVFNWYGARKNDNR